MKMKHNRTAVSFLTAIALIGISSVGSHATTLTWTGSGGDGAWMTLSNWDDGNGVPSSIGPANHLIVPVGVAAMTMDGNEATQQNNVPNAASWTIASNAFVFNGSNGPTNNNFDRFQTRFANGINTAYSFTGMSNPDDSVAFMNTRMRTDQEDKIISFNNTSAGRVLLRDIGFESDGRAASGSNSQLVFTGSAGFLIDSIRQNSVTNRPLGYIENTFNNVNIQMAAAVSVLWDIPVTRQGHADAVNVVLSFNVSSGNLVLQSGNLLGANFPELVALNIGPNGTVMLGGNDAIGALGGSGALDMGNLHSLNVSTFSGGNLQILNWIEGTTAITFNALSNADFMGFEATGINQYLATDILINGDTAFLFRTGDTSGYLTTIPESSTYALLFGFIALGLVLRCRRKASSSESCR